MRFDLYSLQNKPWGFVVLFFTTGTVLCCALPIILVSLGMGAVVASLVSNVPALVTLSLYKAWLFAGSGILLAASAWLLFRPGRSCPVDPVLAEQCARADRWNSRILWVGLGIWVIGFTAAYLLLPLTDLLGSFAS